MARRADAPSKMEILLLTALCRAPMHGYELKLELAYKHVHWWAKCEHGHLYAALTRLERGRFIKKVSRAGGRANQKVLAITAAGKKRVRDALEALGAQPDATYFDVDMFLSGCHVLAKADAIAILTGRRDTIDAKLAEAHALTEQMRPHVPAVGIMIMEHRVEYLERETKFLARCIATLDASPTWGAFLGETAIEDFVKSSKVPLETLARRERR